MLIERTIGQGPESVYAYWFPSQRTPLSFPHKIGHTKGDPIKRIKEQQASMQEEPIIGTLVRCRDSRALESQLHLAFKHRKLPTFGGEWFDIHPDAVVNAVVAGLPDLSWYDQLRHYRALAGLTQQQLGDSAGLRQASVSRVEAGEDVNVRTILELCRELKLRMTFVPLDGPCV